MNSLKFKLKYFKYFLFIIILFESPFFAFAYSDKWVYQARVAGAEMFKDMTDIEIYQRLSELKAQRVSVIEGDSELSNYFTIAQYDSEMAFIARVSKIAHALDLKLVWYYPSLEVLTPNGEQPNHFSMYKDHPDWVQYNIDHEENYGDLEHLDQQTPNVFYGGLVFWVDPGTESAWMCHLSPYRDYFFDRIRRLAATGVDGVWIDVPLFNDIVGVWCCSNPYCREKFENDTGMKFPTKSNLRNSAPNFRRWMIWRHTELNQFLLDTRDAAREINPNFEVVVEIVTCDYNSATHQGLDGTFMGEVDGFTFCWEIDALSDDNAMRNAQPNDWYSLIAINKFCRGASGFKRPSWAFTYGYQDNDAELVLAEAVAAQVNPYDTKIPLMTTLVSAQYRARMYSFIEHYQDLIYSSETAAKVAILYSSSSRDFSDYDQGTALYVTTSAPKADQQWWTTEEGDGLLETNYLAEYRGWVKILVAHHIPFDIVPVQYFTSEKLKKYHAIIMPNIISLSTDKGQLLGTYIDGGGTLIVTGPNPFLLNEYGILRSNPLSEKLALSNVYHNSELLGKQYIQDAANLEIEVKQALDQIPETAKVVSTNAPPSIHLELYRYNKQYILHCTNFTAVTGEFSPSPDSFTVNIDFPKTETVKYVAIASPDEEYNFGNIPFDATQAGQVTFNISMYLYSIAIISFDKDQFRLHSTVRLPSAFGLAHNYPNPFSTSTTITVQLNLDSEVKADIYNVIGQKVRTLLDAYYRADTYELNWDGNNDAGNLVANGIYFCHLRAGVDEKMIKMSVLRRKAK